MKAPPEVPYEAWVKAPPEVPPEAWVKAPTRGPPRGLGDQTQPDCGLPTPPSHQLTLWVPLPAMSTALHECSTLINKQSEPGSREELQTVKSTL